MSSVRKPLGVIAACAVALVGVTALFVAAPAGASTPCAKKILADWLDNSQINGRYPLHCYPEAIDAIPSEIRDYSDAEDVIALAFHSAGGRRLAIHKSDRQRLPRTPPEAISNLDTSAPTAFPLPLLVLSGMSLALVAAGAVGYVSRRRRAAEEHGANDEDDRT
jgi:hypothetical protein